MHACVRKRRKRREAQDEKVEIGQQWLAYVCKGHPDDIWSLSNVNTRKCDILSLQKKEILFATCGVIVIIKIRNNCNFEKQILGIQRKC